MKKEILFLIEYLAKSSDESEKAFYDVLVKSFVALELYTPTTFRQEQICALMQRQGLQVPQRFEMAVKALDTALESVLPAALHEAKKSLFVTLLAVNFPKKKHFLKTSLDVFLSQLEPVEKSIYDNLLAYVTGLNRTLALFFVLAQEDATTFTPERLVALGESLHVKLLDLLFNEEEKALLSQGLKELLGVYLSLYGKYLYM